MTGDVKGVVSTLLYRMDLTSLRILKLIHKGGAPVWDWNLISALFVRTLDCGCLEVFSCRAERFNLCYVLLPHHFNTSASTRVAVDEERIKPMNNSLWLV